MIAMNSLDTNVVLRYLLNDIPEQADLAKENIAHSVCYVTDVVTTEVIFVLERVINLDRDDIAKLTKAFLGLPNIVYNDYLLDQTMDLYRKNKSLSFVDCYAATEAKVYNNHLLTFDKELQKHGGSHIRQP